MNIISRLLKKLLVCLIILISYSGFSQLSKKHYIPPLTSGIDNAIPDDQYIYLSTPSTADIAYTIKQVGLPTSSDITGVISNTNPGVILIGTGSNTQLFIPSSQTSVVVNNKGFIIEAEDLIYVSVRMRAGGGGSPPQAGALVSKGLSALGTTFRVGSFTSEGATEPNYLNFVSVMATGDNTQVTFDDFQTGIDIEGYTGAFPINIILNEGESYTIATRIVDTAINRDGLIGTLVTSDKPIVVNCGSANGSFGDASGNGRDYGIDQIAGLSKVGTKYICVKGIGSNDWENVLVVPHTPNTTISVNGESPFTITGRYELLEGFNYTANGNMYIETSTPVFVYQGIGTNSEANQGMFFVPPLSCEARGNIDNIAALDFIGGAQFNQNGESGVSIVTKVGATVSINNTPINSQPFGVNVIGPSTVTGNLGYVTYRVTGLGGDVSVQGDDELYVAYFNRSGAATTGSFYSGFPSPPEINFDAQFITLGNCIPNIDLTVANAQNFDSFTWYFDDGSGSGFVDLMNSNPTITPTNPGKYKLVGVITCSGLTLESVEVPVSICPDDIDNDGIIDNIDIDNDNDGILNCTESRGDVILNITNLNTPQLIFQDNSTNSLIANGVYTQANSSSNLNTFTGNNIGNFTSSISPATNAENDYSITFTESVNIKLSEDNSVAHSSADGEYFIAKILPNNKNITLIDPDNRLLVDSNFDGIFESGVTQISGSEIHFRVNPTPIGTTPYQFFANQVDGFTFKHILANINDSSTFRSNISLTCFKNDNDFDGIKDELDLDSDNDGIPDFVENQGTLIALSGIDADVNGLDDVYDINNLPIDTDNDSVPDFYDLDSDNDGITDLIESGQLGLLSDTDLNGIVDGPNIGINGWDDNAETAPDSNLIGYTLNDFDADTIFSYIDEDSDGDSCRDVIEAGFSDANNDNFLGDNNVVIDLIPDFNTGQGLVTNATDGYTLPNSDYLDFAPLSITTQPANTEVCFLSSNTISVVSPEAETYQWEVSTDGINWSLITDNINYSGSLTASLTLTNTPQAFNNNQYRVNLNRSGNSCGFYSDPATLTVLPLPILNSPNAYSQCDDETNDGIALFNLTLDNIKAEIDPDYVAKNLIFSYYLDSGANTPINNPQNYQNLTPFTPETVWIGIEDINGCFDVVSITLEVNPSSAALNSYIPQPKYLCDDGLDNRDGISTFDFSDIRDYISNTLFSTFSVTVHFYESQLDAELETNEILDITNHQNTNSPNSQDIWVRVKSDLGNNCLGLEEFPNFLNVEALPTANPVSIQRQCDFDTSDAVVTYPFDTSQIEADLLNGQSLANVSVSYTFLDITGTQVTASSLPNPFLTSSQIIDIRVTNNATNDPNGPCYDETTLEFIVDEQPVANAIPAQIVCDGDAGDLDDDGYFPFDTSSFESTIKGSQTGMDIFFNYIDENGISITNSTTLPNPLISQNQMITVDLVNPINTNCIASTNIEFIVNPLPEFSVDTPRIVCSSDPTFNIVLDVFGTSITETFDYEWTWTSLDGTIKNQFISNDEEITVSNPGTYSITLSKTDGTGCSRTREIFVDASELATITLDDVTIIDITENNSVTINTTNLGMGDYKFGLREEGSPFIVYQDEPIFTNVRAGFYTIYVKDNICGVATLPISVIGHAKFFTPNGDGTNDVWKIKGINSTFQPNSTIFIYDRYGKLIKQLSAESDGWDGTFNGALLPTSDYWFKVYLQDGRQFMGHFTLKR
ncbi:T9SS type B sorting domain-containing protein [Sabulilitoribacter arenilitoris]|uniref:T9SS type B sorting domain-containing protein n=1 Tax=Wocania arenilitoris TaxID=2044858 RepID=A0AAE3JPF8_9FLAO|nr:T9SS type B sorting domain-containing protein [Wocania arenilitoris]MCF7568210.1 T9SS type B sorting domain-containing protein [Wocania arenilitoris]